MVKRINIIEYLNKKLSDLNDETINFENEFNNENLNETKTENKVTELQVHKILYFLYGNYGREYKKELFIANFEAGKYGPVEINFRYGDQKEFFIEIEDSKEHIEGLDKITRVFLSYSVGYLVEDSHLTSPGINNMNKEDTKIPNDEIQKYFES